MTVTENLKKIRNAMRKEEIDLYIIPTADFHQSEYAGDYFQARRFMSGFTGSAGTLVISGEDAALFTDGRYFVQAQMELEGSTIKLMKIGEPGVPGLEEYVFTKMSGKKVLGFDGRVIPAKEGAAYEKSFELRTDLDLVDGIWEDRPSLPDSSAWVLGIEYSGESTLDKLIRLKNAMKDKNADYHIISSLDDIAWIFNIRGNDVENNPVVLAFAIIGMEENILFSSINKFDIKMQEYLKENGIVLKDYDAVYEYVKNLPDGCHVLLDDRRVNYSLYKCIPDNAHVIFAENPSVLMKAVKNRVEIKNEINAHIKDGAAVTKFMYWLKKNIGKTEITELSAAEKLAEFRRKNDGYIGPSFETISAYKENAAMMHYSASRGNNMVLEQEGALLVDSGGQYYEGTTDITRTIGLGKVSDEFKMYYTAVLKGMLNLSNARFLHGCIGLNLDILARGPLWNIGMDYRCGTGHGVGYLLNVHEAPNGFRWKKVPERDDGCVLEEGMITTDEPGVYIEGKYGIRIENELLVEKDTENEYGLFLKFKTLTLAPIDTSLIDYKYMDREDIKRLNEYHEMVFEKIGRFLNADEKEWFFDEFLINMI